MIIKAVVTSLKDDLLNVFLFESQLAPFKVGSHRRGKNKATKVVSKNNNNKMYIIIIKLLTKWRLISSSSGKNSFFHTNCSYLLFLYQLKHISLFSSKFFFASSRLIILQRLEFHHLKKIKTFNLFSRLIHTCLQWLNIIDMSYDKT